MKVSGQLQAPAALAPGKEPLVYPLDRRLGKPQSRSPPIKWVPGVFHGNKEVGAWADHSHPWSAEVKREWRYTSIPPCFTE